MNKFEKWVCKMNGHAPRNSGPDWKFCQHCQEMITFDEMDGIYAYNFHRRFVFVICALVIILLFII